MKIHDLPRLLPQYGLDMSVRSELVLALDALAKFGTTADKTAFSQGLQAVQLLCNDAALPAAVAPGAATRVVVVGTTQLDMIWATKQFEPSRTILASQFVVTTGVVTTVTQIHPGVLRIVGTGLGAADTTAFTPSVAEATRLRYADWSPVAAQGAVGTAAEANLTSMGVAAVVNSATQITMTTTYRNTGRSVFGQFAVNNGGTVSAVSYPDDRTIILTGTGYAAGDIVTYTDPGSGERLNAVAAWGTYTLATGAGPAAT